MDIHFSRKRDTHLLTLYCFDPILRIMGVHVFPPGIMGVHIFPYYLLLPSGGRKRIIQSDC